VNREEAPAVAAPGGWFIAPDLWTDMDQWHREVAAIRRDRPVLLVEQPGYERFWVLTRHEDVFAVSRDNANWHNTVRAVLGPDLDYQQMIEQDLPQPKSLVQLDGADHRDHRAVTNDWFKPAAVGSRQSRID